MEEELTVAEAPEDADTRQSAVAGCFYIYIAVANINCSLLPYSKRFQGCNDGIRRRFLTDASGLVLAYRHFDGVRKEISTEFLSCGHHLIAHHSQSATL